MGVCDVAAAFQEYGTWDWKIAVVGGIVGGVGDWVRFLGVRGKAVKTLDIADKFGVGWEVAGREVEGTATGDLVNLSSDEAEIAGYVGGGCADAYQKSVLKFR